jgi:fatty acid/phospholipid biosynthesis enzyme
MWKVEIYFSAKADVIVCDGYTGNIVLKEAEGNLQLDEKKRYQR